MHDQTTMHDLTTMRDRATAPAGRRPHPGVTSSGAMRHLHQARAATPTAPVCRPGCDDPTPRRPRAVRALLVALALTALAGSVTGCDVHLAQDGPGPLALTVDEQVRAATVADLAAVRDLAHEARTASSAPPARSVRTQLAQVETRATQQIAALGGPYDGPPPTVAPAPATGASSPATAAAASTPTDPPAATRPADVVARLAANEEAARGRLVQPGDPGLARLVAQVATSQDLGARALARAAHLRVPASAARLPARVPSTFAASTSDGLAVLVASEDGAGYVLEVEAARARGAARDALVSRAALHRARGQQLADAAGLAGTDDDPRTTAYAIPSGTARAVERRLEQGLAARYAQALDTAAPRDRTALADLLTDAARAAVDAGGPVTAFPGGTPPAATTPATTGPTTSPGTD
ncbi:DUF4439 domain-containing protein [Luteimicrobium subarcticum]|uniref:Uncharacterized protein DUF4439 n=1 Tax=Luteimicrobium subarcticum TaxID=620910 RepID=A0A2M8WU40_9MICO|nr:DUF4439 domain-containing protein [Luteimicrobium subarcticum]PJI94409.1 uncharacterized protein DUF4439 [Luteimicrobium subarcticum]